MFVFGVQLAQYVDLCGLTCVNSPYTSTVLYLLTRDENYSELKLLLVVYII